VELFNVIPSNMFSVFTSSNKEVYASSLLVLRQLFKDEMMIEREKLATSLVGTLEEKLLTIDMSEENEVDINKIGKDAMSLARFIIRKFRETGWIEVEYEKKNSFVEFITLPPYSIKLINTMHDICEEEMRQYSTYMYSIYSNLRQADIERADYRYAALLNAYDKTLELEDELKTLYHGLRRKYNRLAALNTVNDMLRDHFDEYQSRIIENIYLPLKTKDSITRFKGSVFNILLKWMKDTSIIADMVGQCETYNRIDDENEAKRIILSQIYSIIDKINELEALLDRIDEKNNDYVSATADKMKYLLNSDKSIKGKMVKIFEKLAVENEYGGSSCLEISKDVLSLVSNGYITDSSCFTRANPPKVEEMEPVAINTFDDFDSSSLANQFLLDTANPYSHENILEFVTKQMGNNDEILSKDIKIDNMGDLVMTIFAMLKGTSSRSFYKLELFDGSVENWQYNIPNMKFERRRKD